MLLGSRSIPPRLSSGLMSAANRPSNQSLQLTLDPVSRSATAEHLSASSVRESTCDMAFFHLLVPDNVHC
jgi:hypothetical protein